MDEIFGNPGIDTPYEREQVDYHPRIERPDNASFTGILPEVAQRIERARDFTITGSLMDYDALIAQINGLLTLIDERNDNPAFAAYKKALQAGSFKETTKLEEEIGIYEGTGDAEVYTILVRMKTSCELRRDFIDSHYRTQITDKTQVSEIAEAEDQKINAWLQTEQKFIALDQQIKDTYSQLGHEPGPNEKITILEGELYATELSKQTQSMTHTSLADVGYVHRNRFLMFQQLVTQIEMIVKFPTSIAGAGVKGFIIGLATVPDLAIVTAQLVFSFSQLRMTQSELKGQFHMTDDHKEGFISKEQWFYQQLQTKSQVPLQNWLYNQPELPGAFQSFANLLVESLVGSKTRYESTLTDLLRFYQQEAAFYDQQMTLIQKKELIRLFLRIIKDLKEVKPISEEWASQYVTAHGYPSL